MADHDAHTTSTTISTASDVPMPIPDSQQPEESETVQEKYLKLRQRVSELEEKHQEMNTELQRKGEINAKMQEERSVLLERIGELEKIPGVVRVRDECASNIDTDADADADMEPSPPPQPSRRVESPPVLVSSTGTRLRIKPAVSEHTASTTRSSSPEDRDNDHSGDYAPSRGTKRTRDSAEYNGSGDLIAVAPEPKVPRRSSRRSTGSSEPTTAAPRTRVIQASHSTPLDEPAVPPTTNGNEAHNTSASPPSASPAGSIPYNPYSYLAAGAHPYNPYAYYIPGAALTYVPPPPPAHYVHPPSVPPPAPAPARPPPQQQDAPRATKPKRLKAHTVTSKSYSIPMVPRDKKGKPMLPLNVGIMTVISLGDVCMREHFHTERYIFPVGYEVTRRYLSTVDQTAEVVYHCTILDGGDGPKFQIIPSDVPDRPVIAGTATGAWSTIVKQANALRQRQHSNSVSGPDFFGLGQNTIKHLIQELPNADRLRDYVWQHFVEGGPLGGRHAAVIPALPEEYDKAMPIGAYYPPKAAAAVGQDGKGEEAKGGSYYPPHILAQGKTTTPVPGDGVRGRQIEPPPSASGGSYYPQRTHNQNGGNVSPPQTPSPGVAPTEEQGQEPERVDAAPVQS
ncbi:F/Y rich C-terminus-domain-containing protein [Roridomyces roridus]|uniref:F/Y rich C-terminus-domain-containing protein n=1 Tax=Roridomyces roridus TaxID=1738132 RepID=A0AAD7CCJ9_9AGAR|nr:F/Y rich C-terminus-domain-containing protein [Roridomyces roridus]